MEFSIVLRSASGSSYTAYLGKSRTRAREVQEIVRNVLIQTGATAHVILKQDHHEVLINEIVNGSWISPSLKEAADA